MQRSVAKFVPLSMALSSVVWFACDDDPTAAPDAAPDHDGGGDASPIDGGHLDAFPATDGLADSGPAPVACGLYTACNQRLSLSGGCPGACVPQQFGLACHGVIDNGLCLPPANRLPDMSEEGPLRFELLERPERPVVGEPLRHRVRVTNISKAAIATELRVEANPGFSVTASIPTLPTPLALLSGESLEVTLTGVAERATIMRLPWSLATLYARSGDVRARFPIPGAIGFAEGTIPCGGRVFPEFWTEPDEGYNRGICCADVFYPAAECCGKGDCRDGKACVDGQCMAAAPRMNFGSRPLVGAFRVGIVLVDSALVPAGADPCLDRSATLGEGLQVNAIADWFEGVSQRQAGRPLATLSFSVMAGLTTADLGTDKRSPHHFVPAVEQVMKARGCFDSFEAAFDRVIVVSSNLEQHYQGLAFDVDRISMKSWSWATATHELGHSFGASDLYFTVAGRLHYAGALMSHIDGEPYREDVLRGEVGLLDLDGDGQLDALNYADAPRRLRWHKSTATLWEDAQRLSVQIWVGGEQDGRTLSLLPLQMELSLPEYGVTLKQRAMEGRLAGDEPGQRDAYNFDFVVPQSLPESALATMKTRGRIQLRVRTHAFSNTGAGRSRLDLDETIDAELTLAPRKDPNPGPFPNPGPLPPRLAL